MKYEREIKNITFSDKRIINEITFEVLNFLVNTNRSYSIAQSALASWTDNN